MEDFIAYVGDPDLHDGSVVGIQCEGDTTRITIRGSSGRLFTAEFRGAVSVKAHRAEGMHLYAVSELKAPSPLRRFVFSNWDPEDDACLEIAAETVILSDFP